MALLCAVLHYEIWPKILYYDQLQNWILHSLWNKIFKSIFTTFYLKHQNWMFCNISMSCYWQQQKLQVPYILPEQHWIETEQVGGLPFKKALFLSWLVIRSSSSKKSKNGKLKPTMVHHVIMTFNVWSHGSWYIYCHWKFVNFLALFF